MNRGERRRPTPHLGDRLHARNRYKDNKPDFYALGQRYPSFLQYLRNVDHEKKTASLAFDDPELTATLLKHDFGLDWTMPIDRLCPPVPNRLNYIHWIEDLLHASGIDPFAPSSTIRGIDIGTEIDDVSYASAAENVTRNKLTELIHVQRVTTSQLLLEPLTDAPLVFKDKQVHFSMCNPPFFGEISEADTNPDNSCMGNAGEMVYPGGEVAFIGHMIQDSLDLRDRVLLYTSMIGRKSSLRKVLALLRESGVQNMASIEFFQGRTKRWGVAWSFSSTVKLHDQAKVLGKRKEAQRQQSVEFHIPKWSAEVDHGCRSVDEVIGRVNEYISSTSELQVELRTLDPEENLYSLSVAAGDTETLVFDATIEFEVADDDSLFTVTIEFESGKRDECWRFCESLKAATIRSGRQWRRKRIKTPNSESKPRTGTE